MKSSVWPSCIAALCACFPSAAFASGDTFWSNLGEIGGPVFWAAGLGSSLLQDGKLGLAHSSRTADGFLVTLLATEGLKVTVRERRPYGNSLDSFPSLHTSLSFEIAAAQSYYHPKQAIAWYAAASLIGYSRLPAHEHHCQDVIAGAALGYGAGQVSVSSRHGWLIAPLFENGRLGGTVRLSQRF